MITFAEAMITMIFSLIGIIILAFMAGMIAFITGIIMMKMRENKERNDDR